jgi:hypothetical protein
MICVHHVRCFLAAGLISEKLLPTNSEAVNFVLFLRFAFGLAANSCIACRENTCRRRLPISRNAADIRAKLNLKLFRIRWYHIRELLSFSISFYNREVSLHRDSAHNVLKQLTWNRTWRCLPNSGMIPGRNSCLFCEFPSLTDFSSPDQNNSNLTNLLQSAHLEHWMQIQACITCIYWLALMWDYTL